MGTQWDWARGRARVPRIADLARFLGCDVMRQPPLLDMFVPVARARIGLQVLAACHAPLQLWIWFIALPPPACSTRIHHLLTPPPLLRTLPLCRTSYLRTHVPTS